MYELKVNNKGHYLYVTVCGDLDLTTDMAIDSEIRQECENQDKKLLLIDIRSVNTRLTYSENYFAAKTFPERMGFGICAIAIVDKIANEKKGKIFELAANSRGATVKFFGESEVAELWLLSFLK